MLAIFVGHFLFTGANLDFRLYSWEQIFVDLSFTCAVLVYNHKEMLSCLFYFKFSILMSQVFDYNSTAMVTCVFVLVNSFL